MCIWIKVALGGIRYGESIHHSTGHGTEDHDGFEHGMDTWPGICLPYMRHQRRLSFYMPRMNVLLPCFNRGRCEYAPYHSDRANGTVCLD